MREFVVVKMRDRRWACADLVCENDVGVIAQSRHSLRRLDEEAASARSARIDDPSCDEAVSVGLRCDIGVWCLHEPGGY